MANEAPRFTLSSSAADRRRSALWALAITVPLCVWGWSESMGLAHSGGLLLLLFVPTFPVFLLLGSDGVLHGAPDWAFMLAAAACEYLGVFVVVHAIRLVRAGRAQDGA